MRVQFPCPHFTSNAAIGRRLWHGGRGQNWRLILVCHGQLWGGGGVGSQARYHGEKTSDFLSRAKNTAHDWICNSGMWSLGQNQSWSQSAGLKEAWCCVCSRTKAVCTPRMGPKGGLPAGLQSGGTLLLHIQAPAQGLPPEVHLLPAGPR